MSDYYIDLSQFSLSKLKFLFKYPRLLPSQKILQEDIDERFECLKKNKIENLFQLQIELKTKNDVQTFSQKTGLPIEYLTLLRREVNSYLPKPINLKDFPGVDTRLVQKLAGQGIKNTKQLFSRVVSKEARIELARQNLATYEEIIDLTKLTDVARMKWVGPKFARLLVESEFDTAEKCVNANYEDLYHALVQTNNEKGIYKGKFGLADMKLWVQIAIKDLPLSYPILEIEYKFW